MWKLCIKCENWMRSVSIHTSFEQNQRFSYHSCCGRSVFFLSDNFFFISVFSLGKHWMEHKCTYHCQRNIQREREMFCLHVYMFVFSVKKINCACFLEFVLCSRLHTSTQAHFRSLIPWVHAFFFFFLALWYFKHGPKSSQ